MAVNFPNNPADDETVVEGGKTWKYDGEKWVLTGDALDGVLFDKIDPITKEEDVENNNLKITYGLDISSLRNLDTP